MLTSLGTPTSSRRRNITVIPWLKPRNSSTTTTRLRRQNFPQPLSGPRKPTRSYTTSCTRNVRAGTAKQSASLIHQVWLEPSAASQTTSKTSLTASILQPTRTAVHTYLPTTPSSPKLLKAATCERQTSNTNSRGTTRSPATVPAKRVVSHPRVMNTCTHMRTVTRCICPTTRRTWAIHV